MFNLKSWPCIEAKRIYESINGVTPNKGYVLFETGYGPSGLPHIGTFAEVARTVMVQETFKQLYHIPTKLICFSDDMDALRKIPLNIPNQEMLSLHIGKPLTAIPDPYEKEKSFGHYMNIKLCSFLDKFNFKYELHSATNFYKSGKFDHMMIKIIEKYHDIMNLMLPTFREHRRKTYSPFMPICPDTGIILQVEIDRIDSKSKTIFYRNKLNKLVEVPVTGGCCKLQWKPDFGMRWAALNVDYEMYGKDHRPNTKIYSKICKILEGKPPVQFFYELFLDEQGGKISKSKGNSISIDEWLRYAPEESISLFMFQSPTKAKRLHFSTIPKSLDEYINLNKSYHKEQTLEIKFANPVHYIHNGNVPIIETYGITFTLLLNLVSVCNPKCKSVLWNFIRQYKPNASPQNARYLDLMISYAMNYYNDFIKSKKQYLLIEEKHKILLENILVMLNSLSAEETSEEIQNKIYSIGVELGYKNLRLFFKEIYQILLGQTEGPRLGSFFRLYGISNTIQLITRKLNQEISLE